MTDQDIAQIHDILRGIHDSILDIADITGVEL
jgi:hypothetical protein